MSFLRGGSLLRYIDGMSTSYVYYDGAEVIDYGTLSCAEFMELVFVYAKDKENEIIWDYLAEKAELFMDVEDLREFRKWVRNVQLPFADIEGVVRRECKRNGVVIRETPLTLEEL